MGVASADVQNLPYKGATGTLNTTTANIAIDSLATEVMVWGSVDFACSITLAADTDLDASTFADCVPLKANTTYVFRLNRNRNIASVNVESRSLTGTYEIGFCK